MTSNDSKDNQFTDSLTSEIIVEAPAPESKGFKDVLISTTPYLLIFLVIYFLLIRPQENKRKALEDNLKSLKKGETIITNGGIFATIVRVNDEDAFLEIEIAKNTNIKILKSAVIDIPSRKVEK